MECGRGNVALLTPVDRMTPLSRNDFATVSDLVRLLKKKKKEEEEKKERTLTD